jgi:uncharacterized protein YbjT (DUF2867 family)
MTVTQDTSAPLVVVCGATGTQGGSVIKALVESDRAYRLRGLTRDPAKPTARELANQGVEMVGVLLTVDNKPAVPKAFEGANIVFVSHRFLYHLLRVAHENQGFDQLLGAYEQAEGLFLFQFVNQTRTYFRK